MAETIAQEKTVEMIQPFKLDRFKTFKLSNEAGATAASH
jgi:hypothetical protein